MATGGGRRGARGGVSGLKPIGLPYLEGAQLDEASVFPAPADIPVLRPPTESEHYVATLQLDFLKKAQDSPYWTQHIHKKNDEELLRYTDRYQPERCGAASALSFLQLAPLQKDVFPPHLWDSFTSSESKRAARRTAQPQKRMAKIDWDHLHLEEKRAGEGEEEPAHDSDEEDLGDYEDEVDDDYAQNYFDNGEDDDDMDGDGGDEAAFD
ncbi:hypothetical protein MNAN1_002928 [Malassezia nana]|uniref:DNA-directed RNA polymerase III subunit n=1 Tax=Malassezia nana TaxID=180528 RepID=A0AAF0ENU4_9BASI|nr:hypothetical protein MNAN1_002928 [Malassezia nana]